MLERVQKTVKCVASSARESNLAFLKPLRHIFWYPSNPRFKKLNICAIIGAAGFEKLRVNEYSVLPR